MPTKLIGNLPYQVPRNSDLGSLAFQNTDNVTVDKLQADIGITGYIDANIGVSGSTRPSIRPNLVLDFSKTNSLDKRIDYDRASTGTYFDGISSGISRQNLLTNSSSLSSWIRASVDFQENATIAPDGSMTADMLTEAVSTANHSIYPPTAIQSYSPGSYFTFSVYLKAASYNCFSTIDINRGDVNTSHFSITIDLTNGIVSDVKKGPYIVDPTYGLSYVGNGWYRAFISVWMQGVSYVNVCFSDSPIPSSYDSYGRPSYTVSSTDVLRSLYVWGPQLEMKKGPSEYIQTGSTQITYYAPSLKTASVNTPRFEADPYTGEAKGLLVEESRSNLLNYSQNFSHGIWSKQDCIVFSNIAVAPDGTLTASKLEEGIISGGSSDGASSIRVSPSLYRPYTFSSGYWYTYSIFAKAGERSVLNFYSNGGCVFNATFDLIKGTATGSGAAIQPIGDGWYRCSVSQQASSTAAANIQNRIFTASGVQPHNNSEKGLYVWGAQLEYGNFASSYIPTMSTFIGRKTTGSYISKNGIIEYAQPGKQRLQINKYCGFDELGEVNDKTNLLTYPDDFTNAVWVTGAGTKPTIGTGYQAPDGSFNASVVIPAGTTYSRVGYQYTLAANTTYYFSIYIKNPKINTSSSSNVVTLATAQTNYGAWNYYFNSETTYVSSAGVYSGVPTLEKIGGGWYRAVLKLTNSTAAAVTETIVIIKDGTAITDTLLIWGAQLETGTLSSYMPSTKAWASRASIGTYIDNTGIIRTAPSGVQRFSYLPNSLAIDPLPLIEQQRTNYCLYSEDMSSQSIGTGTAVVVNTTIAPDGNTTGDKVYATTGNSPQGVYRAFSATAGQFYTTSAFVKAAGFNYAVMLMSNVGADHAIFDLKTGEMTSCVNSATGVLSYTCVPYKNGWFRISITKYFAAGQTAYWQVLPTNSPTSTTMTVGDGSSGIYVWGAQIENAAGPSSYIPTGASTVTREADVFNIVTTNLSDRSRSFDSYKSSSVTRAQDNLKIKGAAFSSFFNKQESSYAIEYDFLGTDPNHGGYIVQFASSGSYDGLLLYRNTASTFHSLYVDSKYNYIANTPLNATSVNKSALGFNQAGVQYSYNGSQIYTLGNHTTTDPTQLLLYGGLNVSGTPSGHIKRFVYYPKLLSSTELQSLTV